MMIRDDDQPLWDLLGKSADVPVSPFFARNVVRAVRAEPAGDSFSISRWFSLRRLVPAAACAALLIMAAIFVHRSIDTAPSTERSAAVIAKVDDDSDIAADLDDLVGPDDDADTAIL